MYSDKININILTAVMKGHGIDTAVVCPGSRNAPLTHNFVESGFQCYSVTDERSAGFYAIGLALSLRRPVAVCVTSGSAVLNLAPAVAEAAYRHLPILVISADRPADRIGQLEGQTIVQPGVFTTHTPPTYILPESHDEATYNHCNRLANEAMLSLSTEQPVHINVPITEPLYNFTTPTLPDERIINVLKSDICNPAGAVAQLATRLSCCRRPMILIGQSPESENLNYAIKKLSERFVVIYESLSCGYGGIDFDRILPKCEDKEYMPDFVVYTGDTFVSNRIKQFVKRAKGCEVWSISLKGEIHDTFNHLTTVIDGKASEILFSSANTPINITEDAISFKEIWDKSLTGIPTENKCFSEESAVREFETILGEAKDATVHYANSMAIRLGNKYARHYCYVNRGTNGIEGTLSTAAGFSLASAKRTYCVIGDLSFFYDCNALWNTQLSGNLRILLLNNGGGRIFDSLKGAKSSPAFEQYISASHCATAKGICESYNAQYRKATNAQELTEGLWWLIGAESPRPMVLECIFS